MDGEFEKERDSIKNLINNFYKYQHKSENISGIPEEQSHIFSFEGFRT
jgi:hypothetical protein